MYCPLIQLQAIRHLLVADRRCKDLQKQTVFITREINVVQVTEQLDLSFTQKKMGAPLHDKLYGFRLCSVTQLQV